MQPRTMTKPPPEAKSQRDKFIETARAIGADEDEAAFKKKLEKIVKAPTKKKED
jgi:hypothetical protein